LSTVADYTEGEMIEIPNFVAWFESAKNSGLERDVANALVSASISAWIAGMWRSGDAKWAAWLGEGQALKDSATAAFLALEQLQKKGFLVLTVPKDLLEANNQSNFQTQEMK
jgi:hypothetical protein